MKNVFTKVALAAAVLMGVASSANAFVVLTMTDLSTATTKSCNTFTLVGCGLGSGFTISDPNFVTFNGLVGNFNVRSTQGISNAPGDPTVATADTTSLTVRRTDAAVGVKSLLVDFVVFDFFSPTGVAKTLQGSASTTAGDGFFNSATESVFSTFRVNSDNQYSAPGSFNLGGVVSGVQCNMATAKNNSCDAGTIAWADPALGTPGFSTRTQQAYTIEAGSIINTTSSLTIRNVPEPMTLSLVGLSLVGLGFASRRRAAAKA